MGIPVVATDLPEIRRFNAEQGDVVAIGRDAEHFASAIEAALGADPDGSAARRVDIARRNSWAHRFNSMTALIENVLADKQPDSRPGVAAHLTAARGAGNAPSASARNLFL